MVYVKKAHDEQISSKACHESLQYEKQREDDT